MKTKSMKKPKKLSERVKKKAKMNRLLRQVNKIRASKGRSRIASWKDVPAIGRKKEKQQ